MNDVSSNLRLQAHLAVELRGYGLILAVEHLHRSHRCVLDLQL